MVLSGCVCDTWSLSRKITLKILTFFVSQNVNQPKDVIGLNTAHCMVQYTDFIKASFKLKMS